VPTTLSRKVKCGKARGLNRVRDVTELAIPSGNRLERLKGDRKGQCSIRINEQYRVCFRWKDGYADEVEITGLPRRRSSRDASAYLPPAQTR